MSKNIDLFFIIKNEMSYLISTYYLQCVAINAREVLLKSRGFFISIVDDNEGLGAVYFDVSEEGVKGYNLILFLINKRRGFLVFENVDVTERSEYVKAQVRALSSYLKNAGKDILSGSRKWLDDYSWPVVSLPKNLVGLVS